MHFSKENRAYTLNGILFTGLFALSSLYIAKAPWIAQIGISSLVIAIVLGILYSNTLRHRLPAEWAPGIQFSAKKLLRLAIILYGFRITFQQIASVGLEGLLLDIFIVSLTLTLGTWIGMKFFKLDRHLAILISIGSAICGAAAVLAAEDILKSDSYKAAIAIGTVVLFGTIAMFLYPLLQHSGLLGLTNPQFGLFAGASIHEVAQVLVAGSDINAQTGNIAVIVKMTRVLLLVPTLILLSIYENRTAKKIQGQKFNLHIPWFAIGFSVVIAINSLHIFSISIINFINYIDIFLLTMSMAAIGMETNLSKIKKVGLNPLFLAILLFAWLTSSGYVGVHLLAYFK